VNDFPFHASAFPWVKIEHSFWFSSGNMHDNKSDSFPFITHWNNF
jgi:hypothetical protein